MARMTKIPTPMAKPRGPSVNGSVEMPETTKAVFSDPAGNDCFVPGWDRFAGAQQQMARVAERDALGKKKTPLGRGTLRMRKAT